MKRYGSDLDLLGMAILSLLMHWSGEERWAKRDGGALVVASIGVPADEQVGKIGSLTSLMAVVAE